MNPTPVTRALQALGYAWPALKKRAIWMAPCCFHHAVGRKPGVIQMPTLPPFKVIEL